jgi:hypothetical protein
LITKKRKAFIENILKSEVEVYSEYIEGNVYGYVIDDPVTNEHIDSCWGFIGDHDKSGLMEYATNAIDCEIESINNERRSMELEETGDMSQATMG